MHEPRASPEAVETARETSDGLGAFGSYVEAMTRVGADSADVVLTGIGTDDPVLSALAHALPDADFHVLLLEGDGGSGLDLRNVTVHALPTLADQVTLLAESLRNRPRAIIDQLAEAGGPGRPAFERLFWALDPGGLYILRLSPQSRADGAERTLIADAVRSLLHGEAQPAPESSRELALAIDHVACDRTTAHIYKRTAHMFTVREWPTGAWKSPSASTKERADRIHSEDAYSFASKAELHVYGEPDTGNLKPTITVPERHIRANDGAMCFPRMLATSDGRVLPSSFRHPHNKNLKHPTLVNSSREFVRHRRAYETLPDLAGTYFQVDSTFPGHFGHALTEQLSHLWAWKRIEERFPDAKVIVTLPAKRDAPPSYQTAFLAAFGISPARTVVLRGNESVLVERLITCTPAFESPRYVDLQMPDVWKTVFDHLIRDPEAKTPAAPEKIFIVRPPRSKRAASSARSIERFFERREFFLLRPEQLSWAQQAWIFSQAKVIAGYGGSGMFNMMFNPAAKIIVITSDTYTARNEYLFASALGNEIHYFFGPSKVRPNRPGKHDPVAFVADFDFNLRKNRRDLIRAIAD